MAPTPKLDPLTQRVEALLTRIQCLFPDVEIGEVDCVGEGFPAAEVTFANGIKVIVGVDIALPQVFYEVVRTYVGAEPARYPFERESSNGFAECNSLSATDVECLLAHYDQVVPQPVIPLALPQATRSAVPAA